MALLFKLREGQVSDDRVRDVISTCFKDVGYELEDTKKTQRRDVDRTLDVIGSFSFNSKTYDVLYDSVGLKRSDCADTSFFDEFSIDRVDGSMQFAQDGPNIGFGIAPIYFMQFEPNSEKYDFLKTFADNFRKNFSEAELVILGFQPSRKHGYIHQVIK